MAIYYLAVSPKLFEPVRVIHSRKLLLSSRTYPYEYMLLMILPLEAAYCSEWSPFPNFEGIVWCGGVEFPSPVTEGECIWSSNSLLCVVVCWCCCHPVLAGTSMPKFDFSSRGKSNQSVNKPCKRRGWLLLKEREECWRHWLVFACSVRFLQTEIYMKLGRGQNPLFATYNRCPNVP